VGQGKREARIIVASFEFGQGREGVKGFDKRLQHRAEKSAT
jgi:hypothetical protein